METWWCFCYYSWLLNLHNGAYHTDYILQGGGQLAEKGTLPQLVVREECGTDIQGAGRAPETNVTYSASLPRPRPALLRNASLSVQVPWHWARTLNPELCSSLTYQMPIQCINLPVEGILLVPPFPISKGRIQTSYSLVQKAGVILSRETVPKHYALWTKVAWQTATSLNWEVCAWGNWVEARWIRLRKRVTGGKREGLGQSIPEYWL